jgi:hypothetical protein
MGFIYIQNGVIERKYKEDQSGSSGNAEKNERNPKEN